MSGTPKWNEELPLPQPKNPPDLRYEIQIDGRAPIPVVIRTPKHHIVQTPRRQVHMYSIQGSSTREDELSELVRDTSGPDIEGNLYVDGNGQLHRMGEEVQSIPGGNVVSRARLRHLVKTGRLKPEQNMVNSFRSGKLVARKRPFPEWLASEAASLVNPGAYHGIAIPANARVREKSSSLMGNGVQGSLVVGADGQLYRTSELGVGKFVKRAARGARRGVQKGASAAVKHGPKVAMVAALGPAGIVARGTMKLAARAAAAAMRPLLRPSARAKAVLLAKQRGRATPNQQDRRDGGMWVLANMARSRNPLLKGAAALFRNAGGLVAGDDIGEAITTTASLTAMIAAIKATLVPMLTNMLKAEARKFAQGQAGKLLSRPSAPAAPAPAPVAPAVAPANIEPNANDYAEVESNDAPASAAPFSEPSEDGEAQTDVEGWSAGQPYGVEA